MSEPELSRAEKISAIIEMLGVLEEHHDNVRDGLDLLSDDEIIRQHNHCLVVKAFVDRERAANDG